MLHVPAAFPFVGSKCFFDDVDAAGRVIVEPARILRDNGDGTALLSLTDRRYPHEVASGNRTVPFALLRETEQPLRQSKPSGRTKGRRR